MGAKNQGTAYREVQSRSQYNREQSNDHGYWLDITCRSTNQEIPLRTSYSMKTKHLLGYFGRHSEKGRINGVTHFHWWGIRNLATAHRYNPQFHTNTRIGIPLINIRQLETLFYDKLYLVLFAHLAIVETGLTSPRCRPQAPVGKSDQLLSLPVSLLWCPLCSLSACFLPLRRVL